MRLFEGVDRTNEEACLMLLEPDDVRAKFELEFLRFSEAMDMILPDPKALEDPYQPDLKWLARLRVVASRRYRDDRFDAKPYGAKVGEIITRHLSSDGVEQLLAPRDILDPAFRQYLDSLTSAEAKAAEIEHAIKHEIHVHRDENPAAYTSLWEQVEKIVNERREARVSAASALARLQGVADQIVVVRAGSSPSGQGLSGTAGAILPFIDDALTPEVRTGAATDVAKALEGYTVVVDWQHKEDVQRQMRRGIKERLRTIGMDPAKIEAATAKVMDVARARYTR
jgi:type I restriction enzyme R subunit